MLGNKCVKCDCNGNSDKCDPDTGVCIDCVNETSGDKCEKCAKGFYMDPVKHTCEKCLCPDAENSKSSKCEYYKAENQAKGPYVCLDCEQNTVGAYCEECARGFYKSSNLGTCIQCKCGIFSEDCDKKTGVCKCAPNYAGPNCDQCEPGSFGDPGRNVPCTSK
ncbi:Laminin subunit alpha-1 [Cichlidogyrus casuarinus]|uniref:Laminin subunit alpha-1 n=1 Tax=Cichlidogyrus casuarinus TaxID=1844966 RepID=A0ABD2QD97_9PLAT